jgi:hypothetical protein
LTVLGIVRGPTSDDLSYLQLMRSDSLGANTKSRVNIHSLGLSGSTYSNTNGGLMEDVRLYPYESE